MKKNKNLVVIIIIIALLLLLTGVGVYFGFGFNKTTTKLEAYEISNVKQVDSNVMPDFTIVVQGLYDGVITKLSEIADEVPVYTFDAGVQTSYGVLTDNYTGIKVRDVLNKAGYTDFSDLTIKDAGNVEVHYKESEISDNAYLVFYRNGKYFDNDDKEPVHYIDFNYHYRYAVEDTLIMIFQ